MPVKRVPKDVMKEIDQIAKMKGCNTFPESIREMAKYSKIGIETEHIIQKTHLGKASSFLGKMFETDTRRRKNK